MLDKQTVISIMAAILASTTSKDGNWMGKVTRQAIKLYDIAAIEIKLGVPEEEV